MGSVFKLSVLPNVNGLLGELKVLTGAAEVTVPAVVVPEGLPVVPSFNHLDAVASHRATRREARLPTPPLPGVCQPKVTETFDDPPVRLSIQYSAALT